MNRIIGLIVFYLNWLLVFVLSRLKCLQHKAIELQSDGSLINEILLLDVVLFFGSFYRIVSYFLSRSNIPH